MARAMAPQLLQLAIVLFCWLHVATAAPSLPYIPTTALQSPVYPELIYIFSGASDDIDLGSKQLLALNTSTVLYASNITNSIQTVTDELAFLSDVSGSNVSFVPVMEASGQILLYSGDCSNDKSTGQLWRFESASPDGNPINGTWKELPVTAASGELKSGPAFLGGAFSFQTIVADATDATMYVFGGMCPVHRASESVESWQSNATYTNSFFEIVPSPISTSSTPATSTTAESSSSATSTTSPSSYSFQSSSEASGPIAEAGFTITSLAPTYSNTSTGQVIEYRNYVLLGGHTKTAFLNMSQVALYSLPENSWSFVTIEAPILGDANTELIRSAAGTAEIDSRSGHTTTLSSDGSYLIVYGGWVGDVNTPASPQLAVLRLGAGFGGDGQWQWEIPAAAGTAPALDGIYGHGAALLEGDVLMIYGGYSILSSSARTKRDDESSVYFLNTTSMSWGSTYTNPSYSEPTTTDSSSNDDEKVALGAGLGLGLAAILAAVIWYCWYSRKLKRERKQKREAHLSRLGEEAHRYQLPRDDYPSQMTERTRGSLVPSGMQTRGRSLQFNGPGYEGPGGYGDSYGDSYAPIPGSSYDNGEEADIGMSGAAFTVPRKALHSASNRGYYQAAPGVDPNRPTSLGTSGIIHPIYEADEEQSEGHPEHYGEHDRHRQPSPENQGYADPFRDQNSPTRLDGVDTARSLASPTPEAAAMEREREIREWVADWEIAAEMLNSSRSTGAGSRPQYGQAPSIGRVSPVRAVVRHTDDDSSRTDSNLSDRSAANLSSLSRSGSNHQRSNSFTRILASASSMNPFSNATTLVGGSTGGSPTLVIDARAGHTLVEKKSSSSSGEDSTHSFQTAHTSSGFAGLQAEGENLLPRPLQIPGSYQTKGETWDSGSPSKSKPPRGDFPRSSWLGSLRRAFVLKGGDDELTPTKGRETSPTRVALMSTTFDDNENLTPRRAVSSSAALFRRKQGRGDWDDSGVADEGAGAGAGVKSMGGIRAVDDEPFSEVGGSSMASRYGRRSLSPAKTSSELGYGVIGAGGESFIEDEEEEWDIEKAVEKRVVQVMFTVPREKLRVVNHDVNQVTDDSESEIFNSPPTRKSATFPHLPSASAGPSTQVPTTSPVIRPPPPAVSPAPSTSSSQASRGKVREIVDYIEARTNSPASK